MTAQTAQPNSPLILSDEALAYLKSYETYEKIQELARSIEIEDESKLRMLPAVVLRALSGIDALADLPTNIRLFLEISEEQTTSLLKKLGESVLVAIIPSVSGLEQVLKSWGTVINESAFLEEHKEEAETIDQFVQTFIEVSPDFFEPRIQHRLKRLLIDFASKQTTREKTIEMLVKQEKTGGLEMDEASAEAILADFEKELADVEIVTEQKQVVPPVIVPLDDAVSIQKTEPVQTLPPEPVPVVVPAPVIPAPVMPASIPATTVSQERPSAPKIVAFTKEDEAEIARTLETKQHIVSAPKPTVSEEQIVERVCKHTAFQFDDPVLQERCISIVNSRVHEIRDAFKTRAQLEKTVEAGGLGVSGRKLADMVQVLEDTFLEYQETIRSSIQAQKKPTIVENKEAKEQAKLDEKYGALTKQVRTVVSQQEQTASETTQEASKAKRSPLIRPNMNDIQFARRLVGPVEELSTMTLVEFRRLSEIPERAIEKILSKIDLLEQQGYDKKVQGVTAWRNSPMQQQYLQIAQESLFNGKHPKDIIETHQASGEQMMTVQEYLALLKLNATIRF